MASNARSVEPSTMTHQTLDYANRIRERGFRLTPQRELVLEAVCDGNGHTSFDEIKKRVETKAPAINRSTIYRTLEFLQKNESGCRRPHRRMHLLRNRPAETPPPSGLLPMWRRASDG